MSGPFENLSKAQITRLYELLGVHIYKYNKGDKILQTIKNENVVCILHNGLAQIIYTEYNGNEIIIENLEKDSVFGSNITYISNSSLEIIAKERSEVVVIDYNKLVNNRNVKHIYFNVFLMNLFEIMNLRLKERNDRIRILEKKQIREKLLEYFEIEYKKVHSRIIYMPYTLKDLADYIAVNRSAMFRELKSLKEERFIEIKSRRITLLYKY